MADRLDTRLEHLKRLSDPESGFVVDKANEAFHLLYEAGPKPASILVRSGFVAREKPLHVEGDRDRTPRPKPPAADIRRSRGIAMRLELALIFVQQCRAKSGMRLLPIDGEGDALGLINLFATGTRRSGETSYRRRRDDMRANQVGNALNVLNHRGLVELGPSGPQRSPFDTMWLTNEAGPAPGKDPARYKSPTADEATISIPIEFFTNGWIQVLTDSEIWNWLAFRNQANRASRDKPWGKDVHLNAWTRLAVYDLTRDAWDTHLMLDRYGLMTVRPGDISTGLSPTGKQRFRREPHAFDLDDKVLQDPGHPAVTSAVAAVRDEVLDRNAT